MRPFFLVYPDFNDNDSVDSQDGARLKARVGRAPGNLSALPCRLPLPRLHYLS
mgnify:CR=1 FL=1